LTKIGAVNAGGAFNVDFVVGNRKHGVQLYCQAVNYTGGVGLATKHLTGGGNDQLTVTPTLTAGREPTLLTIVAAGNGYNVGDTFQIVDATGVGAVFVVTVLTGGAGTGVAAASYNAGTATASPVEPDFLFSGALQINIGSATQYNVDPIFYAMRRQAVGLLSPLGVLNIDFTDPSRNWLSDNDITSWDTFGARSMTIVGKINANAVKPSVTGDEEFDFRRNNFNQGGTVLFANPFKYVQQVVDLVVGTVPISNLTLFGKLVRLYVRCQTTASTITQIKFTADGQVRVEGNVVDVNKRYRGYGFHFGDKDSYAVANIATSNTLKALLNPLNFFDAAYVSDYDGQEMDALPVINDHKLELTSTVAQKATIYMECLPGKFM